MTEFINWSHVPKSMHTSGPYNYCEHYHEANNHHVSFADKQDITFAKLHYLLEDTTNQ